jgi:hypothetical protein
VLATLALAVIGTLDLSGEVPAAGGDYQIVEFEVPAGTVEIHIAHSDLSDEDILDWGVWSPEGFRGWGGGLEDDAIIGVEESSRGYLPGPITPGTWQLVIGKARIASDPAAYQVTVTFHDAPTLAVRERAEHDPGPLATGPRWYAGDFHVHSRESGDAVASFAEIRTLARERRLDFVLLSDHNTVSQQPLVAAFQAANPDFLFLRGIEVTTYGGHGNAMGIADYVDHRIGWDGREPSAMIADVVAQGGIFSINHPTLALGNACLGCAWVHDDVDWSQVTGFEIHTGTYEVVGTITRLALEAWDAHLDAGRSLTGLGGSDDHRAGMDLGGLQSPIGSPTTLVYTDELSEAAILDAVRAGRAVVKLRGPDDPMATLLIEAPDGTRGMIGDRVAGHEVTLEAQVTGGAGLRVVLYEDGEAVDGAELDSDDVTVSWVRAVPPEGGRWRLHVIDGGLEVTVTNHVFADHAEPPPDSGCGCGAGGSGAGMALLGAVCLVLLRRRRGLVSSRA